MSGKPPVIYWDSCIFLAWLKNETRDDFNVPELHDWLDDFERGNYRLVTSIVTRIEVLESSIPADKEDEFRQAFVPPRAQAIQLTPPIVDLAHDIRNQIRATEGDGGPNLKTPDAIHLATALVMEASELHTTDCGKKGGRGLIGIDPIIEKLGRPSIKIGPPTRVQVSMDMEVR